MNKSVFFRLTARYLKYELCNSLNYYIQNNFVKFNLTYKKLNQKFVKIKILQNMLKN